MTNISDHVNEFVFEEHTAGICSHMICSHMICSHMNCWLFPMSATCNVCRRLSAGSFGDVVKKTSLRKQHRKGFARKKASGNSSINHSAIECCAFSLQLAIWSLNSKASDFKLCGKDSSFLLTALLDFFWSAKKFSEKPAKNFKQWVLSFSADPGAGYPAKHPASAEPAGPSGRRLPHTIIL